MTFGKDGFLYVAFGEYGNPNNGQDFSNRITGGVIRIFKRIEKIIERLCHHSPHYYRSRHHVDRHEDRCACTVPPKSESRGPPHIDRVTWNIPIVRPG